MLGVSVHDDPAARHPAARVTPYAPGDDQDRRPAPVRDYIQERQENFPGVDVKRVFLRKYPYHSWPRRSLGNIGQISPAELKATSTATCTQGTIVGQDGLEYSYDRYLRGRDGLHADRGRRRGNPTRDRHAARRRRPGASCSCRSTSACSAPAQDAMAARRPAGCPARSSRWTRERRGARDGLVPELRPAILAAPITPAALRRATSARTPARRRYDRAIAGSTRRARRSSRSPRWPR